MSSVSVGLLPLYLKLYDDAMPEARAVPEQFAREVAAELEARDLDVIRAPLCRLESEVRAATARFTEQGVDLLITLHTAYSPSLEAVGALEEWDGPILMLDTTPDTRFGQDVDPDRIMYNHGVHGVQDLATMLRRRGRAYDIVAGHFRASNVIERAAALARAARAARLFRGARVLRIGCTFAGMGDFQVTPDLLEDRFGIQIDAIAAGDLAPDVAAVSDEAVEAECARDRERFAGEVSAESHARSVRVGLGLRKRLEEGGHTALTMNFQSFDGIPPVETVPFLEASKAMARGLGYAGECDALTAAFVGVLNAAFGRTTFTEIFCPDWEGGTLFLSHMGEFNVALASSKPLLCEKPFPWSDAHNPVTAAGAPEAGPAVLANLAPGPDDTFRLIVAPVAVLPDETGPKMAEIIRAWVRPRVPLAEFLECYSLAGGTHHSALVLGQPAEAIRAFGQYLGVETVLIT